MLYPSRQVPLSGELTIKFSSLVRSNSPDFLAKLSFYSICEALYVHEDLLLVWHWDCGTRFRIVVKNGKIISITELRRVERASDIYVQQFARTGTARVDSVLGGSRLATSDDAHPTKRVQ